MRRFPEAQAGTELLARPQIRETCIMPRLAQSVPKYRKQNASGQAFVELNGQRHYLGPHGSKRSAEMNTIGEWLQNGRKAKPVDAEPGRPLVVELIAR